VFLFIDIKKHNAMSRTKKAADLFMAYLNTLYSSGNIASSDRVINAEWIREDAKESHNGLICDKP
jgi:hypothetical protein